MLPAPWCWAGFAPHFCTIIGGAQKIISKQQKRRRRRPVTVFCARLCETPLSHLPPAAARWRENRSECLVNVSEMYQPDVLHILHPAVSFRWKSNLFGIINLNRPKAKTNTIMVIIQQISFSFRLILLVSCRLIRLIASTCKLKEKKVLNGALKMVIH